MNDKVRHAWIIKALWVMVLFAMAGVTEANAAGVADDDIMVCFRVYDKISKQPITVSTVSVVPQSDSTATSQEIEPSISKGLVKITMPRKTAKYMITLTAEKDFEYNRNGRKYRLWGDEKLKFDYDTLRFELDLTNLKNGETERWIKDVYMSRHMARKLDEVSVTASKVKFYYKGDTLVYNADAFVTAEGSMLDGLLKQMPGVELKPDGEIRVNGRKVQSLLLNGKDLFGKDHKLMLENLAAYTVKTINIYNHTGRDSKLLGFDVGDVKYVMDVKLKRQYSMGYQANAEGGYGSHDRYKGRLFGMWFSDNVSLSAYGTTNNLNDLSQPESTLGFGSGSGVQTTYTGGINYHASGPKEAWKLKGMVRYTGERPHLSKYASTRNYLSTGDTYGYSWLDSRLHSHDIESNHTAEFSVKLRRKRVNMTVEPEFRYHNESGKLSQLSAEFDSDMGDSARSVLDAIYAGGWKGTSRLLNRMRQEQKNHGNDLTGAMRVHALMSTGKRSWLTVDASGRIENRSHDQWQAYDLTYGDITEPGGGTRLRHYVDKPNRNGIGEGSVKWSHKVGGRTTLSVQYEIAGRHEKRTYGVDGLDVQGWDELLDMQMGVLPSMAGELRPIADQSYRSLYKGQWHAANLELDVKKDKRSNWSVNVKTPLKMAVRSYDYERGGREQHVRRNNFMPGINLSVGYRKDFSTGMSVSSTPGNMSLANVVDVYDKTDPLNVRLGNPNLKDFRNNGVRWWFMRNANPRAGHNYDHQASVEYNNVMNANAMGYYYDMNTGVKTSRIYNVDGNYTISGRYAVTRDFEFNKLSINTFKPTLEAEVGYVRSVDLAGTTTIEDVDFSAAPPKRKIGTLTSSVNMDFYMFVGSNLYLRGGLNLKYNRYMSSDTGFEEFSSWNNMGFVHGVLRLPHQWSIMNILSLYTRRGYTDRQLNTTDLIWDAKVSKSLLKGRVVISLSGNDLLRQLKNVAYTINAQARTETVSNIVPSYVMLSVQWRWSKQPKQ